VVERPQDSDDKADEANGIPEAQRLPIRRARPPARTHAAPKAGAFSGHPDGPVDGPESARNACLALGRIWHGRVVLRFAGQDSDDLS
jgi:hypothetical protein